VTSPRASEAMHAGQSGQSRMMIGTQVADNLREGSEITMTRRPVTRGAAEMPAVGMMLNIQEVDAVGEATMVVMTCHHKTGPLVDDPSPLALSPIPLGGAFPTPQGALFPTLQALGPPQGRPLREGMLQEEMLQAGTLQAGMLQAGMLQAGSLQGGLLPTLQERTLQQQRQRLKIDMVILCRMTNRHSRLMSRG